MAGGPGNLRRSPKRRTIAGGADIDVVIRAGVGQIQMAVEHRQGRCVVAAGTSQRGRAATVRSVGRGSGEHLPVAIGESHYHLAVEFDQREQARSRRRA